MRYDNSVHNSTDEFILNRYNEKEIIKVYDIEWREESEQIVMHDEDNNLLYLENCSLPNGLNALNVQQSPKYVVLGQLYRNKKDLGVWILHSDDKKIGILLKKP